MHISSLKRCKRPVLCRGIHVEECRIVRKERTILAISIGDGNMGITLRVVQACASKRQSTGASKTNPYLRLLDANLVSSQVIFVLSTHNTSTEQHMVTTSLKNHSEMLASAAC